MNHEKTNVAALRTANGACFFFPRQNGRNECFQKHSTLNTQTKNCLRFSSPRKKKRNRSRAQPCTKEQVMRRTHCSCWFIDSSYIVLRPGSLVRCCDAMLLLCCCYYAVLCWCAGAMLGVSIQIQTHHMGYRR